MTHRQLPPVEVAPVHDGGYLSGFLLLRRWPEDPVEWAQFLVLAVQMAAMPGMLPQGSTVFRVVEQVPEGGPPGAIGLVHAEGQLLGDHPLVPGQFADSTPPGLAVLHPPSSTVSSVSSYETASGCILLPGVPDLGLDHRAAWAEADRDGTVTRMASRSGVDPLGDADTAALSLLLVA
ncbi:peptidase [Ornithinimicrobium faecis]|uniref:Peptidase n=1 Tax=Ornithinimicrobium faecis TaxID=2934158 RepID=A0ABY4YQA2_9MICO|nr:MULTISPECIES: peptidase [unclassified Ornithinimicrobium]USQ78958.1 peptidase [Ornithinimicrobium sp. HY1793]